MATRTQAREVVAQLLYAYGSGNDGITNFIEEILSEQKIKNAQSEFAKALFNGVLEHLEEIDLRIKHQIKNWDFERIGDMERAILRLGVYEILFSKTDKAIVINEALEITKNFSNEASTKFINGILDGIAKNATLSVESIKEALEEAQKQKEQQQKEQKESQNVGNAESAKKDSTKRDNNIKKKGAKDFKNKESKSFKNSRKSNFKQSNFKNKKDSTFKKAEK
ncbi:transcription antitermination factor NusB [Helicobacter sp. MIT 11-5569]|uniref:transcription antitermination factor NusB n=1 Tax=Helicobacter sp. MIT 11-5569 TaxID=1548151 RepID=UPI0009E08CC2|nr:transcription antitermination factor NusB [Helicobacter sp. MIT 11-5569]TLD83251.1 transcription antitermination factor NusB [Helicobacter sp. MIT 11-5569]